MSPEVHQISDLIQKYLLGTLSAREKEILDRWLSASDANRLFFDELTDPEQALPKLSRFFAYDEDAIAVKMQALDPQLKIGAPPLRPVRRWGWVAAAALMLCIAGYVLLQPSRQMRLPQRPVTDIPAGRSGAILTLGDGTQIVLDSMSDGLISTQSGTQVLLRNRTLSYQTVNSKKGATVYNTMQTPKGRQFSLVLPDGSKVWLNAASSIRYPAAFTGKERKVEITGEVYFEIAQRENMPFIVNAADQAGIEVLGTKFNVEAYTNESSLNATLFEGSVRVSRGHEKVLLQPGQQAQVTRNIKVIENADPARILAWKNGLFNFEDMGLEEVMRQLERWYDIEVIYEKNVPGVRFGGKLDMQLSLADMILALEESKLRIRMEGRKLIVLP